MAKTKEELEADKKAAESAKKPYTVGEVAGRVGSFFSEAFSGPTSNYIKRQEREKQEAGQDNTGRASATAAAVANTVGKGVSKVAGDIAEAAKGPVTPDNINTGSASSSAFGGVIPKTTSGNAAGETAEPEAETSFYEAPTNKELEFKLGMQSKENQAALNKPMSEEVTNVMADIARARAETGLGRESEDSPAAPAAPAITDGADAYSVAQKDFNEKFGGSMGRAMEGETADQYEARLKERNVNKKLAQKELAKLKPQDEAQEVADAAGPENTVLKPIGGITGTSFGDTSLDLTPREFMAPPTSPQAKSSAQDVANKPSSGQTPTTIQSPQARLKGRQEFGSYLEGQLSKSGGNYTFNKDDQARAKELGIGRKEMDNFTKKLSRRDEEEEPRRRRLGQIGGNKFGA